jgi:hypothetical protein
VARRLETQSLDLVTLLYGAFLKTRQVHARERRDRRGRGFERVPQRQLPGDAQREHLQRLEPRERSVAGIVERQLEASDLLRDPPAHLPQRAWRATLCSNEVLERLLVFRDLLAQAGEELLLFRRLRGLDQMVEQLDGGDRSAEVIVQVGDDRLCGHGDNFRLAISLRSRFGP